MPLLQSCLLDETIVSHPLPPLIPTRCDSSLFPARFGKYADAAEPSLIPHPRSPFSPNDFIPTRRSHVLHLFSYELCQGKIAGDIAHKI